LATLDEDVNSDMELAWLIWTPSAFVSHYQA